MTKAGLHLYFKVFFQLLSEILILYFSLYLGWAALFTMDEDNGSPLNTGLLLLSIFLLSRLLILATWNVWKIIRKALEKRKGHSSSPTTANPKSRAYQLFIFMPHLISEIAILALIVFFGWLIINPFKDGYDTEDHTLALCMCFIIFARVLYFFYASWKNRSELGLGIQA